MPTNEVQAVEDQDAFVPLAILENAFRFWWILALLIVLGGLVGLLVHSFNPPVYEAVAQFSVAIDYVSTGPLTQYSEDLAINTAGNIFYSSEVLANVVDQANSEGITTDLTSLQKQITLERQFSVWNLRVRDRDPVRAERLATIWLREGEAIIQQSYQHAIRAYLLDQYIQTQEGCLVKSGAGEVMDEPCKGADFAGIQKNLQDAGTELFKERQASRGLFAGLTFGPTNPPEVSEEPVKHGKNQYVFLGSLLGLLSGVALIEAGAYTFFEKKS